MQTQRSDGLAARAAEAFAAYRAGDIAQLDQLVDLITPILWHAARGQGLDMDSAKDTVQTAWLRLVENADRITDPQAVLGWLLVTVRREAWRMVRAQGRVAGDVPAEVLDPAEGPELQAVVRDRDRTMWQHVAALTPRCQALLRVIAFSERPDYAEVSRALGMPVGSIGPTRGRCLDKLRASLAQDPSWAGGR